MKKKWMKKALTNKLKLLFYDLINADSFFEIISCVEIITYQKEDKNSTRLPILKKNENYYILLSQNYNIST